MIVSLLHNLILNEVEVSVLDRSRHRRVSGGQCWRQDSGVGLREKDSYAAAFGGQVVAECFGSSSDEPFPFESSQVVGGLPTGVGLEE